MIWGQSRMLQQSQSCAEGLEIPRVSSLQLMLKMPKQAKALC